MNHESEEAFADPTDRAALESDRNFLLRMRDRERRLIVKIDEAFERIGDGNLRAMRGMWRRNRNRAAEGASRHHPLHRVQVAQEARGKSRGEQGRGGPLHSVVYTRLRCRRRIYAKNVNPLTPFP